MTVDRLSGYVQKLKKIVSTPSYRQGLRHGVAAATEHHHDAFPPDIRTVLDVGANRGQFALVVRERWPRARLVCFEPLPGPRTALIRVLRDHPPAEIVDAAVGSTPGTATIHVSRADASSSLLPITERQSTTFPGTEMFETMQVRTVSLDEQFPLGLATPGLLKIDVQGFELEVLRGATRVLDAIAVVLVECSFVEFYRGQARADDVIRYMHDRGFSLTGGSAPTLDRHRRILQLDLIFTRFAHPKV